MYEVSGLDGGEEVMCEVSRVRSADGRTRAAHPNICNGRQNLNDTPVPAVLSRWRYSELYEVMGLGSRLMGRKSRLHDVPATFCHWLAGN